MKSVVAKAFSALSLAATALGQACQTVTVTSSVPSDNVALGTYSYCGGTLNATAYIANLCYNKVVELYYTNRQGESTPLSVISFGYDHSISNTNYELWTTSTAVYVDGITEMLNLTYQAVDIGQTYVDQLHLEVNATGAPAPSLPSVPAPYASPSGLDNDIKSWLDAKSGSEAAISLAGMFRNINPAIPGAVKGVVVAARSGPSYSQTDPDYEYNWVRDASLTMDVVQMLYSAASKGAAQSAYEQVLFEYASARATEQTDPGLITGLGEPKFYLNNTAFTGPWGRPQNDGPATAAITLMEFANDYLANGGSIDTVKQKIYDTSAYPNAPVQKDLLFVAQNWSSPSFDLWEEEESDHFYTRMVQRRALIMGTDFANKMGDSATASTLQAAAEACTAAFDVFWDPNRQILLYEYGPVLRGKSSYLDTAVILGVIHGNTGDGFYGYTNEKVLATAVRLAASFKETYPLANITQDTSGNTLGTPIGRYPEDVYTGYGTATNGGNPWYLCTLAFSQLMYSAANDFSNAGSVTVTDISKPFWDYFASDLGLSVGTYNKQGGHLQKAVKALEGWGDAFTRTAKYYTPADGSLTEEYNRDTGKPQGAADLTWSYASLLTAAFARSELQGGPNYVKKLANLGFANNTSP